MITRNSINNPFISCTARDMSYTEVERFWCPPYDCYELSENAINSSVTPIVLEGARGSGKTMILKHLSFFCKREKYSQSKYIESVKDEGFLGIYFRYSADYGSMFDAIVCSEDKKKLLFDNYFQLSIIIEISKILREMESEMANHEKEELLANLSDICGLKIVNISEFIDWAETEVHYQDKMIRNSQYYPIEKSELPVMSVTFAAIIKIIRKCISQLKDILFIIIIDEYENIGVYQKIINTYIKQLDGANNYSFRIGVRPEGIVNNYSTCIGEEFLQEGRDFLLARLEVSSDNGTAKYKRFVEDVINLRLNTIPAFSQGKITIAQLLGKEEDYSWEANFHTKGKKLRIEDFLDSDINNIDEIREVIGNEEPLVAAYYAMRISRGISLQEIRQTIEELKERKNTAFTRKYKLDMQNKYRAALLFWIVDKCRTKKLYYSLKTYLYLSCGSIYDFIGLCRTLFDELESDYYNNLDIAPEISREKQAAAARKYANSQLAKVKINHDYGTQMWLFAQNMCNLFSYYHKGNLCTRYPETNQFYVQGSFPINGVNKEIWRSLIKWAIVIKKTTYQRPSLSVNGKVQLYYINKLYYPIFNISCRIRGGYNFALTDDIWNCVITSQIDPATIVSLNRKMQRQYPQQDTNQYEQLCMWD